MPGRPVETPAVNSRRARAYEMYFGSVADGRRMSLRAIATATGVTLKTVQNWRDKDRWEARVREYLDARVEGTEAASRELSALMRTSLARHITALNRIIDSEKKSSVKIRAIREFVDIYKKLGISLPKGDEVAMPEDFVDDLTPKQGTSHVPQ